MSSGVQMDAVDSTLCRYMRDMSVSMYRGICCTYRIFKHDKVFAQGSHSLQLSDLLATAANDLGKERKGCCFVATWVHLRWNASISDVCLAEGAQ
jgi:hypothetical protein